MVFFVVVLTSRGRFALRSAAAARRSGARGTGRTEEKTGDVPADIEALPARETVGTLSIRQYVTPCLFVCVAF